MLETESAQSEPARNFFRLFNESGYMSKLEELRINASVQGVLLNCFVTVVSVQWFGSEALELTYKDPAGKVANELLYRHDEPRR